VRGANIAVKALFAFSRRRAQKGGFLAGVFAANAEDTYWDEIMVYGLAFIGFYCQWTFGFSVPWPLNFFLWPFQALETYLQWRITSA
jgi:hypothetical protein